MAETALKNRVSDILHNYLASRVELIRPILAGFWAPGAFRTLFLGAIRHLSTTLDCATGFAAIVASQGFPLGLRKNEQADWPVSTLFSGRIFPDRATIRK
jgi:hypothetical protein